MAPTLDQDEPAHPQNGIIFMTSPKATRDCNDRMEENGERDFFAVILEPGSLWIKKTEKKASDFLDGPPWNGAFGSKRGKWVGWALEGFRDGDLFIRLGGFRSLGSACHASGGHGRA